MIKTESIYKNYWNAKPKAWFQRPSGQIKIDEEAQALLSREAKECLVGWISKIDLNHNWIFV